MEKKYDLIIYIGRFQPLHNGHVEVIKQAQELSETVLVLIGSKNSPRTPKNPWTYYERMQMIEDVTNENVLVAGIRDFTYDDNAWVTEVGSIINNKVQALDAKKIGIIGHDKDHSSFYLNYFKHYDFIEAPAYPSTGETIDATKIRQLMFSGHKSFIKSVLPKEVNEFLTNDEIYDTPFFQTVDFALLQQEWDYIEDYKKRWSAAPYDPTFTTADAVVIQSGHVLLIKRGEFPGNGLWAMPGGFVNPKEKIRHAVLRELREETKLKVPVPVLDRAVDAYEMFDDPDRSLRGRTITHVYRITLDATQDLPKVKGSDDAKFAKWVPLAEFQTMESVMFEDHYHIINHMLRLPSTTVRGGL